MVFSSSQIRLELKSLKGQTKAEEEETRVMPPLPRGATPRKADGRRSLIAAAAPLADSPQRPPRGAGGLGWRAGATRGRTTLACAHRP